jgi:hypothetical protein
LTDLGEICADRRDVAEAYGVDPTPAVDLLRTEVDGVGFEAAALQRLVDVSATRLRLQCGSGS